MYAMIFGFVALAAYEAEWIRRLQKRHGECRSNLEDTIRLLKDQLRSVGAAPPGPTEGEALTVCRRTRPRSRLYSCGNVTRDVIR